MKKYRGTERPRMALLQCVNIDMDQQLLVVAGPAGGLRYPSRLIFAEQLGCVLVPTLETDLDQ